MFQKSLLCYLLLIACQVVFPQWHNTKGPYGGSIWSMLADKGQIYAGTDKGIYASSNNGANWSYLEVSNEISTILSIAATDSFVFAGTFSGILKSQDQGKHWTELKKLKFNGIHVRLFTNDNILYCMQADTVFKSSSNGVSWQPVFIKSAINERFSSVLFIDSFIFVNTSMATYRSGDQGKNWQKINAPANSVSTTFGKDILFATVSALYISHDFGDTWMIKNYGSNQPATVSDIYVYKNDIFIASSIGILTSLDTGNTWVLTAKNITPTYQHVFTANDSFLFLGLGYYHGIFRYNPGSKIWANTTNNMNNTQVTICYSEDSIIIAGTIDGAFYSADLGDHWTKTTDTNLLKVIAPVTFAKSHDTLFAMANNTGIIFSIDKGRTWQKLFLSTYVNGGKFEVFKGVFYIRTNNGLMVSFTGGKEWELMEIGEGLVRDFEFSEPVWLVNTESKFYISIDHGKSWLKKGDTFGNNAVYKMAIKDSIIFVVTAQWQIYASRDLGNSWEYISASLVKDTVNDIITNIMVRGNYLIAGNNRGAFMTKNLGQSWEALNDTQSELFAGQVYQSNKCLFISETGRGIWYRPFSDFISSVSFPDAVQSPLKMYPNPTLTGEKFSIESALVKVGQPYTIYDIYGSVIKKAWVDDNFQIETDSLRTGIYMIEIKAGDTLLTGKLLVN